MRGGRGPSISPIIRRNAQPELWGLRPNMVLREQGEANGLGLGASHSSVNHFHELRVHVSVRKLKLD